MHGGVVDKQQANFVGKKRSRGFAIFRAVEVHAGCFKAKMWACATLPG